MPARWFEPPVALKRLDLVRSPIEVNHASDRGASAIGPSIGPSRARRGAHGGGAISSALRSGSRAFTRSTGCTEERKMIARATSPRWFPPRLSVSRAPGWGELPSASVNMYQVSRLKAPRCSTVGMGTREEPTSQLATWSLNPHRGPVGHRGAGAHRLATRSPSVHGEGGGRL